jgi:hypothetical protein
VTGKSYIIPYKRFIGSMVPNWLMVRPEISQGAKLCYGRLCQFAGKDGNCYPTKMRLAKELGVSDRMVYNYIRELEKFALIEIVQNQKTREVNKYRFLNHLWITDRSKRKNLKGDLTSFLPRSYRRIFPAKRENKLDDRVHRD